MSLLCSMSTLNTKAAREIASLFLDIGAVKFNLSQPYTWASGWKSPIYCDGRLTLSYPMVRDYIKSALTKTVRERFAQTEAIAGVATAGIPQGALVADVLSLPFMYVRSKAKGHGMENLIEGKMEKGSRVTLIEDLVSTGGSVLKAAAALDLAGYEVDGVVAVFTYGFDIAQEKFDKADVPFYALCNYDVLLQEAVHRKLVSTTELTSLQAWRKAPEQWGK
jgi:orotate phosphoribosyltransferase